MPKHYLEKCFSRPLSLLWKRKENKCADEVFCGKGVGKEEAKGTFLLDCHSAIWWKAWVFVFLRFSVQGLLPVSVPAPGLGVEDPDEPRFLP